MAYYNERDFRRQPESRRYPAGGRFGRGFGRPRRRHGRGYGAEYGEGPLGAYGYEYGGRGPVWTGERLSRAGRSGAGRWGSAGYGDTYAEPPPRRGPAARRAWNERAWRPAGYEWGARPVRGGPGSRSGGGFGGYGAAFERFGYGTQFGGPAPIDRERGRGYERGEEPRYGYTPSSRWPEDGHDVDHLTARERAVSDDDVRDIVNENLSRDHWLNTREIDVDVDHGVVTLRGDVNDYMEARYAWDDAWESQGVRGVINNLTVRTDRPAPEMDLPQTSGRTRGGRERS